MCPAQGVRQAEDGAEREWQVPHCKEREETSHPLPKFIQIVATTHTSRTMPFQYGNAP